MSALVARSVALKAAVVAHDEREGGVRKILNFGHTLGHAVEAESGYALRHGEAVAVGMALEAELAELAGIAAAGTAAGVRSVLADAGLPTTLPAGMDAAAVLDRTRADKKVRAGAVEYALPTRLGRDGRGRRKVGRAGGCGARSRRARRAVRAGRSAA
jgi:3-dehydroquinate synthase